MVERIIQQASEKVDVNFDEHHKIKSYFKKITDAIGLKKDFDSNRNIIKPSTDKDVDGKDPLDNIETFLRKNCM